MTVYLVSYEVQDGGREEALINIINSSGDAMRVLGNVWLVDSDQLAKQIRDQMKNIMAPEDRAVVIRCGTGAAWSNILGTNKWMVEHLSSKSS